MKSAQKCVCLLLAVCMLFSLWIPVNAQSDGDPQIVDVSPIGVDSFVGKILVTFSEPMHVFNLSQIQLVATYLGEGYQKQLKSVEYIDPQIKDANQYSERIVFSFDMGSSTTIQYSTGIRICEYNMGDTVSGYVSASVIAGINGEQLTASHRSGSVDIAFKKPDFSFRLLTAEADNWQVALQFSELVNLNTDFITVTYEDAVIATASDVIYGGHRKTIGGVNYGYDVTVIFTPVSTYPDDVMPNGALLCIRDDKNYADGYLSTAAIKGETQFSYAGANVTISGSTADTTPGNLLSTDTLSDRDVCAVAIRVMNVDHWADPSIDYGTANEYIVSGKRYHFMNCDTGRSIRLNDVDVFELEAIDGNPNLYCIKTENGYLDISGYTVTEIDTPEKVLLYPLDDDRWQIITDGKKLTMDSDDGTGEGATIDHREKETETPLECSWYITEETQIRPLKVMPLGDSITEGVIDGGSAPWAGYRERLSEELISYFGRVVFVGSDKEKAENTDTGYLSRHEGHAGWIIKNSWGSTREEISAIIDAGLEKYQPDLVLLQIGTNDVSEAYASHASQILANFTALVDGVENSLGENGMLFCASPTPFINPNATAVDANLKAYGENVKTIVQEFSEAGGNVTFLDNYNGIERIEENFSKNSEGKITVHPSAKGYEQLAKNWYDIITSTYGKSGIRKDSADYVALLTEQLEKAKDGDTVTLFADEKITEKVLVLPAGVTLDLNGHVLTVANLMSFGDIIDSTQGAGKVTLTQDSRMILNPNNSALPLYDVDGYRFFAYELTAAGPKMRTQDAVSFGVQLIFTNNKAYKLLTLDDDITVTMALSVMREAKETKLVFTFDRSTLSAYEAAWKDRTDLTKIPTLVLTVSGIEDVQTISCTPSIAHAAATVQQSGTVLTYSN